MRTGTYNANDRPVIIAHVYHLPSAEPFSTQFIIDSGADRTVLSGGAAIQSGFASAATTDDGDDIMRFPPGSNVEQHPTSGVGGESMMYTVQNPVEIGFVEPGAPADSDTLRLETLSCLQVAPNTTHNLLGRDILDRFDVTFSYADQEVEFQRQAVEQDAGRDVSIGD